MAQEQQNKLNCEQHGNLTVGACTVKECKVSIYACLQCIRNQHSKHIQGVCTYEDINNNIEKLKQQANSLQKHLDIICSHIKECIKFINFIVQGDYLAKVKNSHLPQQLQPLLQRSALSYQNFFQDIEQLERVIKQNHQTDWTQFRPTEDSGDKLSQESKESLQSKNSQTSQQKSVQNQLQTQQQRQKNVQNELCNNCSQKQITKPDLGMCQNCYQISLTNEQRYSWKTKK